MTPRHTWLVLRLGVATAGAVAGFVLLQEVGRNLETAAAVGVLHLVGATQVFVATSTSILVVPSNEPAFRAVVTPTCSALAPLLALICLASLLPRRRVMLPLLVAMTVVVGGNIVRIAASVGVGVVAGRSSLVLFHDWVGSVFAFAYTLGGFVLMLLMLLPKRTGVLVR
jgi:exosortase/archaeosortase family protein